MDDIKFKQNNLRNYVTQARHQKEVFLQITIPIIIFFLIFLILSILAVYPATAEQDSLWADISLIFLLVPAIIILIILLIILVLSVYATFYLIKVLPNFFFRVYQWLSLMSDKVQWIGVVVTEPFIRVNSWMASVNKMSKRIRQTK